jgi:hypothetical protein
MMFVPHRKYAYQPPWPVTGMALLIYMKMMFISDRKHTNEPPRPVKGIALFYQD